MGAWAIALALLAVGATRRPASTSPQRAQSKRPEAKQGASNTRNSPVDAAWAKRARLNEALIGAVKQRKLGEVKSLLSRGANPDARDNSALKHWKRLMEERVTEQDTATGKLSTHRLGQGARPYLGPTALMIAAYEGDTATMRALAQAGADLNARGVDYGAASASATNWNVDLENRVTPLIEAMMSGEVAAMELLLKKGARVNALDSEGLTALDWAQNMTPTTAEIPPGQAKFLDGIFGVLRRAGARHSYDLKPQ